MTEPLTHEGPAPTAATGKITLRTGTAANVVSGN